MPVKNLRLKDYSSGESALPVLLVWGLQEGIFHTNTYPAGFTRVTDAVVTDILE